MLEIIHVQAHSFICCIMGGCVMVIFLGFIILLFLAMGAYIFTLAYSMNTKDAVEVDPLPLPPEPPTEEENKE